MGLCLTRSLSDAAWSLVSPPPPPSPASPSPCSGTFLASAFGACGHEEGRGVLALGEDLGSVV